MPLPNDIDEEPIFQRAIAIADPDERIAFVRQQCHGDEDLKASILKLLWCDAAPGQFLLPPARAVETPKIVSNDTETQTILLGKYKIVRELGRGGQAATFLAHDLDLQRPVVIKEYHCAETPLARELVLEEGRSLSRIASRYVVRCLTVESTSSSVWLILEYVRGVHLEQYVANESPSMLTSIRLIAQVARGLSDIHSQCVVHRDLTPRNILVTADESPRLIDFGLATNMDFASRERVGGTPPFMPPEQARRDVEQITQRSDVFSLGAILFWILTGRHLYEGNSQDELLSKARRGEYPKPSELRADIPPRLESICLKAIAVRPHERYESAAAMARDLEEFLNGTSCGTLAPDVSPISLASTQISDVGRVRLRDTSRANAIKKYLLMTPFVAAVVIMMSYGGLLPSLRFDRRSAMPASRGEPSSRPEVVLSADTSVPDAPFGISVAIDGDTIAVGDPSDPDPQPGSGAVSIFELQPNHECRFITKLRVASAGIPLRIGHSLDLDNDTLVVGTSYESAGSAYVYERLDNSWQLASELKDEATKSTDRFGSAVVVAGDTIAVGAFGKNESHPRKIDAGAVYVYERDATDRSSWHEVARLVSPDSKPYELFGYSLASDGKLLLVGAPSTGKANASQGEVYVFERIMNGETASWRYSCGLQSLAQQKHEQFGRVIDLAGDTVAVSAIGDPDEGDYGAVYVFRRPNQREQGWQLHRVIEGQNADPSVCYLGYGLALSKDASRLLMRSVDHAQRGTGLSQVHVVKLKSEGVHFGKWKTYRFRDHAERIGSMAMEGSTIVVGNVDQRTSNNDQDKQSTVSLYFVTEQSE